MKFLIVLMLSAAVIADVSHLKLNADRHYLPPERTVHDEHQHAYEEQHHYKVSKPKALAEPERVTVPHSGLNTFVADLPLRQQLFTPTGDAGGDFNQAQGSDSVVYATAPNSVFHTQINVQSQGSEFNVPRRESVNFDESEDGRAIDGNHGRSYKQEHHEERTETHKPRTYHEQHNKRTHHSSHDSIRTDDAYKHKRPNYQGLNLINGNIAADQASSLPAPPNNLHGNAQGINIINGNLLGKHEQAPQFGYKPKQSEPDHDTRRSGLDHKTADNYREHHYEHNVKKVDDHLPRHYDEHKEYDYHKSRNEHDYKEKHDHKHERKYDDYNERKHDDHQNERKHKEHDHYERKHTEDYKSDSNHEHVKHNEQQHDQHHERNQHKAERKNDYYDHHEHYDQHHNQHGNRQHHDHHNHYDKSEQHSRQYHQDDHAKSYKNQHDDHATHQARNFERQHYTSDLHEKPKYQQSIVSKPAIKIIAFNNNNQPNFPVSPLQAQVPHATHHEHLEEYDPSASAPEVIYRPGDEIDFAETKLIDYHDNRRPLESYNYIRKKPQQRKSHATGTTHGETDLRADGYHYGKPKVSFDF